MKSSLLEVGKVSYRRILEFKPRPPGHEEERLNGLIELP